MYKKFIIIALMVLGVIIAPAQATEISCGDTITTDTILYSDLSCSGTAITIGADNIVLDCQGHTISGTGTDYGIPDWHPKSKHNK